MLKTGYRGEAKIARVCARAGKVGISTLRRMLMAFCACRMALQWIKADRWGWRRRSPW
jgi:hypothetical protein